MPIIRNEVFTDGKLVSAEVIDLDAGTLTVEQGGVVKSTRALAPAELDMYQAMYIPPVPVASAEEKLGAAKAVLDQITALPAPVLTADVVDLLDDLRGVL